MVVCLRGKKLKTTARLGRSYHHVHWRDCFKQQKVKICNRVSVYGYILLILVPVVTPVIAAINTRLLTLSIIN